MTMTMLPSDVGVDADNKVKGRDGGRQDKRERWEDRGPLEYLSRHLSEPHKADWQALSRQPRPPSRGRALIFAAPKMTMMNSMGK